MGFVGAVPHGMGVGTGREWEGIGRVPVARGAIGMRRDDAGAGRARKSRGRSHELHSSCMFHFPVTKFADRTRVKHLSFLAKDGWVLSAFYIYSSD